MKALNRIQYDSFWENGYLLVEDAVDAALLAEDAHPSSPNPMPTRFQGLTVRGERTGKLRSASYDMRLPELPSAASLFDQQARHS